MTASLVQLAAEWQGDVPAGGLLVEEKKDGWRASRFPGRDGKAKLWTRGGISIEGAGHIMHRLALMERVAGEPLMFDGEFQVSGSLEATKAWCERGWRMGGEAGHFYAFDVLTVAEWRRGGSDMPQAARKARLESLWNAVEHDPCLTWEWRAGSHGRDEKECPVSVLPDTWAFDAADVLDEVRRVWAAGGEGVVLKDGDAPYRCNRNNAWRKVKHGQAWRLIR